MSALSPFLRCHAITAKWEGGWSDHPSDPGGKTMYGITEAVWKAWNKAKGISNPKPVRQITRVEAEQIYFKDYWLAAGCEKLAAGVDLAVYDASVNSGVSRGRKWLLASIGGFDHETVKKICAARLTFLRALKNYAVFGKGWFNRVSDIEAQGVKMALENQKASQSAIKDVFKSEADSAAKAATSNKDKATTSGMAGAGGTGTGAYYSPEMSDVIAGYILGGIITVTAVAVLFFIIRSMIQSSREKSYKQVAP